MLRILLDEFNLEKDGKAIVLKSFNDYAHYWNDITSGILMDEQRVIILRMPTLGRYFRNLKQKFGSKIDIVKLSPRLEWKKEIGFDLPPEVSEQQAAGLLSSEGFSSLKEKDNKKLATLCALLNIAEFSDFESEYFMQRCILENREERFANLASDAVEEMAKALPPEKREFWRRVIEDKNKREIFISAIKSQIVTNYPHDSSPYKRNFKQSLMFSSFDFPRQLSEYLDIEFKDEIRNYLDTEDPQKVFAMVSGKLEEEWAAVIRLLRDSPSQNKAVISSLLMRALEYPDVYREIRNFEPVDAPSEVVEDDKVQDWLDKYFAFFLYTRRIDKAEYSQGYASIFEDFMLEHCINFDQFFSDNSILTIRHKIERLLKAKHRLLLLVVDGLSYFYHEELKRIFGTRVSFAFSTLPTVTEINKRRILSGLVDLDGSYGGITEKLYSGFRWKETDSNKQDLGEFLKEEHDFYIYWENRFDNYIHEPMTFAKRFNDHIELLDRLSKHVSTFVDKGGIVFLTGDHGYTTLPHTESNKIQCAETSRITHSRVLEIDERSRNSVTTREVLLLRENLAVAKGYRYFNSYPKGATHGGATPEEMTVPFLVIEKKPANVELLGFRLPNDEEYRRRRKQTVKVIVYNPNAEDIEVTSIRFMPRILRLLSPMPILFSHGECRLDAELDLGMVKTEQCKIFVEYQEAAGRVCRSSFAIRTTGAMTEKDDDWE